MKRILLITLVYYSIICSGQDKIINTAMNYIDNKLYLNSAQYNEAVQELLFINVDTQKMYHIKEGKIIKTYIISSSEYGIGSEAGSNKTPQGLHKVKQKFGDNTPVNGRMIGRIFYGQISTIYTDTTKSKTDDITSRILWLDGLEKGLNKGKNIDSYTRYIYIHGTSEEGRLGSPASHGCIRMKNKDIIKLYEKIKIGTLVLIL